jgi:hypothetical protein
MAHAPFDPSDRARILAALKKSGRTQTEFCAGLRASGLDLSARTLRSWARAARLDMPGVDAEAVRNAIALLRHAAQALEAALADHPTDLVELQAAAASEHLAAIRDSDAPAPTARAPRPLDRGSRTTGAAATHAPQGVARFSFDEEWQRKD